MKTMKTMPRYTYYCEKCEETLEVTHSIKEKLETCECEGALVRVPSFAFILSGQKNETTQRTIGDLTNEHIEESKKELRKEQNKLKSEEYK